MAVRVLTMFLGSVVAMLGGRGVQIVQSLMSSVNMMICHPKGVVCLRVFSSDNRLIYRQD